MDRRSLLQQSCKISGKRLPSEYARVEYLESTGTQWIDTGYPGNKESGVKIDFAITQTINANQYPIIFGSRRSGTSSAFNIGTNGDTQLFSGNFDDVAPTETAIVPLDTNKHRLALSKNGLVIDDTIVKLYQDATTFNTPKNCAIFTMTDGSGNVNYFIKGRCYFCQISDNDTLVRYFLPVIRLSDMKPGLYDMVNDQFYVNQGTGEFLYGPYVEPTPIELITFKVNALPQPITYQAEAGMTWEQFVNSSYNTSGFEINELYVTTANNTLQIWINGGPVSPSDEIINDGLYYYAGGGSND